MMVRSLGVLTDAVPFSADDLAGYAGALFDHMIAHPDMVRLTMWKLLERPTCRDRGDGGLPARRWRRSATHERAAGCRGDDPVDLMMLVIGAGRVLVHQLPVAAGAGCGDRPEGNGWPRIGRRWSEPSRAFRARQRLSAGAEVALRGLQTISPGMAAMSTNCRAPRNRSPTSSCSSTIGAMAGSKFGPMTRRIVLFELNEVPWRIVDEYVAEHPGAALARILPRSRCYTTITADRGHLSPWTTWPTLHRGVNDEQHMIASFGQDRTRRPVLSAGLATAARGRCLRRHLRHPAQLPGPRRTSRATASTCRTPSPRTRPHSPRELAAFQEFNLTMVRASSRNVDTAIPRAAALRFLRSTPKIGIRPGTFAALAEQLVAERRKPWLSTRRRSFQSIFAFDLFDKQL